MSKLSEGTSPTHQGAHSNCPILNEHSRCKFFKNSLKIILISLLQCTAQEQNHYNNLHSYWYFTVILWSLILVVSQFSFLSLGATWTLLQSQLHSAFPSAAVHCQLLCRTLILHGSILLRLEWLLLQKLRAM